MTKQYLLDIIDNFKSNYSIIIKQNYPDIYSEINSKYLYTKFSQRLYHYIFGEDIGNCLICGDKCKFGRINIGYSKYCSYKCSGISKNEISHEMRSCKLCSTPFNTYKFKTRQYCSDNCRAEISRLNSKERCNKSKMTNIKNHGGVHSSSLLAHTIKIRETKLIRYNNPTYVNTDKAKLTKLAKYGNSNYNNIEKGIKTLEEKYGVSNAYLLSRANGQRITKGQQKIYDILKIKYPDALLEYQINELRISVDIYIPSKNLVIEYYGDYWHCNPKCYQPEFYNKSLKKTAFEIWKKDFNRETKIKDLGYNFKVIWEKEFNTDNSITNLT